MFDRINVNRFNSIKEHNFKTIRINRNTHIVLPKLYGWIELLKMIPKLVIVVGESLFELIPQIFFIIVNSVGNVLPWIIRVEGEEKRRSIE